MATERYARDGHEQCRVDIASSPWYPSVENIHQIQRSIKKALMPEAKAHDRVA
jgi:hypothetical protein